MIGNTLKGCLPAVFAALLLGAAAQAQNAPAPVGNWGGHPYGVDNYPVYLTVYSNGTCALREPKGGVAVIGLCSWNSNSSNGGILTLHYDTPSITQTFHNQLYLGVTWINRNSIALRAGAGPNEGGVMNRL